MGGGGGASLSDVGSLLFKSFQSLATKVPMKAVEKGVEGAATLATKMPIYIEQLKVTLIAIVILVLMAVVGTIVWRIFYSFRPRWVWLNHFLELDSIDNKLVEDTAAAIVNFYAGFPLQNHITSTEAFPAIYNVNGSELQALLNAIEGRINVHRQEPSWQALHAWVSSRRLPDVVKERKPFHTAVKKALVQRDEALIKLLHDHAGNFQSILEKWDNVNMFNYIDYYAYDKKQLYNDHTLQHFGHLATPGGMAIKDIFSRVPLGVRDMVSDDLDEVKRRMDEKLQTFKGHVDVMRKLKKVVLERMGSNEGEYTQVMTAQRHKSMFYLNTDYLTEEGNPKVVLFTWMRALDAVITMLTDKSWSVSVTEFDSLKREHFHNVEKLVNAKYDIGNGEDMLLNEAERKSYLDSYLHIVATLQYKQHKAYIDDAIFLTLYYYEGNPAAFNAKMSELSAFYLAPNDLYLFASYDKTNETYRRWRNLKGSDIRKFFMDNLITPYYKQYIETNIFEKQVKPFFNFKQKLKESECTWYNFVQVANDPCTFTKALGACKPPRKRFCKGIESFAQRLNASTGLVGEAEENGEGGGGKKKGGDEKGKEEKKEGFWNGLADKLREKIQQTREKFTQGEKEGFRKKPVVEPFLGGLFKIVELVPAVIDMALNLVRLIPTLIKLIGTIVTDLLPQVIAFFLKLMELIPLLINQLVRFFTDPIGAIRDLIGIILYMVTLFVMIFLKLGNPSIGHLLLTYLNYVKKDIYILIFQTVVNVAAFLLTVAFGSLFAFTDIIYFNGRAMRFFYRAFLACEVSPYAWYEESQFHKGNVHNRNIGVLCLSTCGTNYSPIIGGFVCKRTPSYMPRYCPQAMLMRIKEGKEVVSPFVSSTATPGTDFTGMSRHAKAKLSRQMMEDKAEFFYQCKKKMADYDPVARNLCRHIDMFAPNDRVRSAMQELCKTTYCRTGSYEPFCYKMVDVKKTRFDEFENHNLFMQALIYTTVTVAVTGMVYYIKNMDVLALTKGAREWIGKK